MPASAAGTPAGSAPGRRENATTGEERASCSRRIRASRSSSLSCRSGVSGSGPLPGERPGTGPCAPAAGRPGRPPPAVAACRRAVSSASRAACNRAAWSLSRAMAAEVGETTAAPPTACSLIAVSAAVSPAAPASPSSSLDGEVRMTRAMITAPPMIPTLLITPFGSVPRGLRGRRIQPLTAAPWPAGRPSPRAAFRSAASRPAGRAARRTGRPR